MVNEYKSSNLPGDKYIYFSGLEKNIPTYKSTGASSACMQQGRTTGTTTGAVPSMPDQLARPINANGFQADCPAHSFNICSTISISTAIALPGVYGVYVQRLCEELNISRRMIDVCALGSCSRKEVRYNVSMTIV